MSAMSYRDSSVFGGRSEGLIRRAERLRFERCLLVVRHRHAPRLTADLTIFDVILFRTAARIDTDFVRLSAVGAHDDALGVGGAVAEWKLLLEIVKPEIDHAGY